VREASVVGRERESGLLTGLLDEVRDCGAALVITGIAGIGKTTLLEVARKTATERDMLVLAAGGIPAEANLPFAGLHRLLQPVLARAGELPPRQREAVHAAFGMGEGTAPEPFMIALGVLGLLGEVAAGGPLLIMAEDAHWLDRPTADALAFVSRRIESDPIVLLAALREGYDSPLSRAGLPELRLDRLTDEVSGRVLDQAVPGLSPGARERVLTEAEGNPLALRELAVALGPGGRAPDVARLPLTQRLEEAFAARAAELPAPARTLVRVAATAEDGQLATILAGAGIIDAASRTIEDLMPAVRARLVEVDGQQVRFRHPLMQSAIYQSATVAERHAAHAALSGLFADDPDRRVWHRWAAAVGPDPVVAAEVEEAGRRALRRGAVATAAVAFERAAGLERDVARRGQLLLEAAVAASDLGRSETVIRLLAEASSLGLGPHEQAQCMLLEDGFRAGPAGDPAWVQVLVETASRAAARGDRDLALNLLVAAASRCYWGNLHAKGRAVILAADAIASESDDHRMLYIQAWAAPIERGEVVLREFDRAGAPVDAAALYRQGMAVCLAGGFDRAAPLLAASARRLREQGRLHLLGQVLSLQAWAAVQVGDFAVAVPAAEEARRLASELERPESKIAAQIAEAQIAALRGDRTAVAELTAEAESVALPIGAPGLLSLVLYARGTLELGYGRHAEAYEHLRRIHEPGDAACHHLNTRQMSGDFVEAAVRSGHRDEALTFVRELEPLARRPPSPWFGLQMLYARLYLATDEEAGAAFAEALSRDLAAWPVIQARIKLAYGEWLRRHRRQVESRVPLRAARAAFDALGMSAWAERTRQELRAAGESSQRRERDSLDELTPQELQIVQMVAQGLSNRVIAERLYLSRRTVESHLYRVFPKLGVTSRAQLASVVAQRPITTLSGVVRNADM
jgi:DNA-binding CsgD family transcriptional regulator/tetratricopeptide (TPR) repeat protein